MYKIMVGSSFHPLAVEHCRISALSSADYCLGSRMEVGRGRFAWQGSKQEILRLFQAEQFNLGVLEKLEEGKHYSVLFCA